MHGHLLWFVIVCTRSPAHPEYRRCEKSGQPENATVFFERCLHCARLSNDSALEGDACHRLGKAKHTLGDYHAAIELQTQSAAGSGSPQALEIATPGLSGG